MNNELTERDVFLGKTHYQAYSIGEKKMIVYIPNNLVENNIFFEHSVYGDALSGSIEVENKLVTDYDGVYELPVSVARILYRLGYTFEESILSDVAKLALASELQ